MAKKLSPKEIELLLAKIKKPKQTINAVENTGKNKPRPEENPVSKEAMAMFMGQLQKKGDSQKRYINDAGPAPVYKNVGEKVRADLERESRQRDLRASIPNEKFNNWVDNVAMPVADAAMIAEGSMAIPKLLETMGKNISPKVISAISKKELKNSKNFKSEINWEKWNPEIPKNTKLLKEYNAIEQNAKVNKTWMKNPDGSEFKGTPEQFVQQNSENFKKAFGDSKLINEDGSPIIHYHGSPKKFDTFNKLKFGTGNDDGLYGKGIYTSPDKYVAKSYSYENMFDPNRKQGEIYELYVNSKNPGFVYKNNERVMPTGMAKDFNRGINNDIDKFNYDLLDVKKPGNHHEVVIPFKSNPKSSIGNNGMFDMTNPNIYKALIPALIGKKIISENTIDILKKKKNGKG